ncbi:SMP-30/gluconolactonase/LRE family protein [Niastella caeni]|uniref:SMP-30/gluconolactonase/LRE family protein n=1 Tax=Niastella caeni TaxID=2569763 RepID=UPI001FB75836|nr:SMP-30/gluconolactonase/LRE family protein [Niastella caeni]
MASITFTILCISGPAEGVTVFNSQGQQIWHISIPERWTANVAFGGKHRNKLFITAAEAVYVLEMK